MRPWVRRRTHSQARPHGSARRRVNIRKQPPGSGCGSTRPATVELAIPMRVCDA
jgi:hypothetical protein